MLIHVYYNRYQLGESASQQLGYAIVTAYFILDNRLWGAAVFVTCSLSMGPGAWFGFSDPVFEKS